MRLATVAAKGGQGKWLNLLSGCPLERLVKCTVDLMQAGNLGWSAKHTQRGNTGLPARSGGLTVTGGALDVVLLTPEGELHFTTLKEKILQSSNASTTLPSYKTLAGLQLVTDGEPGRLADQQLLFWLRNRLHCASEQRSKGESLGVYVWVGWGASSVWAPAASAVQCTHRVHALLGHGRQLAAYGCHSPASGTSRLAQGGAGARAGTWFSCVRAAPVYPHAPSRLHHTQPQLRPAPSRLWTPVVEQRPPAVLCRHRQAMQVGWVGGLHVQTELNGLPWLLGCEVHHFCAHNEASITILTLANTHTRHKHMHTRIYATNTCTRPSTSRPCHPACGW